MTEHSETGLYSKDGDPIAGFDARSERQRLIDQDQAFQDAMRAAGYREHVVLDAGTDMPRPMLRPPSASCVSSSAGWV